MSDKSNLTVRNPHESIIVLKLTHNMMAESNKLYQFEPQKESNEELSEGIPYENRTNY